MRLLVARLAGMILLVFSYIGCLARISSEYATTSPSHSKFLASLDSSSRLISVTPSKTDSDISHLTNTLTLTSTISPSPTFTMTSTTNPMECVPTEGDIEYGLVKWILDGDTIVVDLLGQLHTVHYLGIDAPEYIGLIDYRGPTAARLNEELTQNQLVRLVKDGIDKDASNQLLRYVFVGNIFINYELVRQGLAHAVAGNTKISCEETFFQAEEIAKQEALGIWEATRTPHHTLTPTKPTTTLIPLRSPFPPTSTRPFTPMSTPTLSPIQTSFPTVTLTPILTPTFTITPTQPPTSTITFTPTLTPTITFTASPSPVLTATSTLTSTGYFHILGVKYDGDLYQKSGQND